MKQSAHQFSRTPVHVPPVNTKHRQINTGIPCPGTEDLLLTLEKYESRSMQGQMPIVWDRAEDFSIFDKAGNCWIDFTSTIFVSNVGHANPSVTRAIQEAAQHPLLHSYAYANEARINYLKQLIHFTQGQFEKAFLLSAGTEATEAALKLMRMAGQKKQKRHQGIICIEGNYHGRTMGAHMMSVHNADNDWVGYRDPQIHHIPFPYPWATDNLSGAGFLESGLQALTHRGVDLRRDICGFMLETFQGWGAVFYPKDFVQAVERVCRENDILLAFDEMQAGFARTGKRFGFEHYEVSPDLICCGKGMGSGLPLSGVLGSKDIMDLPAVGDMSSTHSANPLVCAAGMATLDEIEERDLVNETARKGDLFHQKLNEMAQKYSDNITCVLGKGLLAALLFKDPQTNEPDSLLPSRFSERCMQKGVLVVHTGRESVKLGPPLTITDEALMEGVAVMDETIAELLRDIP